MSELKPRSRALFRGAREEFTPTERERARMERAFVASLAAGAATAGGIAHAAAIGASPSASAASAGASTGTLGAVAAAGGGVSASSAVLVAATKWVGIVLLVGATGTGGYYVHRGVNQASPGSHAREEPLAPLPVAKTPSPLAKATVVPLATAAARASAIAAPATPVPPPSAAMQPRLPVRTAPSSLGPSGTLAEEAQLLRNADEAVRNGDAARALVLLGDHARLYPGSILAEERSADRISALCKLGRIGEARDEAQRFLRAAPDSPLADSVRASCGAASPTPPP